MLTRFVTFVLTTLLTFVTGTGAFANGRDGRLDIYFIDVEGGAATLFVTPSGESLLIDSGAGDNNNRDRDRVLKVVRNVAELKQIDHAAVTHWHADHYGNHAAIAAMIKVKNFWDRGIPDVHPDDPAFADHVADYRRASENHSKKLTVGDVLPLKSGQTPLSATVVTANGEVIANDGPPNPFAKDNQPKPRDGTDNANSLSFLLKFGKFKFLCCGDLTWNVESKLVTPNNPLGQVDLFMVTHHGLDQSNNPTLVLAIDPRVAVMCNGPHKGGEIQTQKTLKKAKSLEALYQLHRNLALKADQQVPASFIANEQDTADCQGVFVKASVAPDGASYTVQIGSEGKPVTYQTR